MKTLKLLFGMAIATTLLFTACDKTDDAQCTTEQYKKDIVGEWVAVNPDAIGNPEASYIVGAFSTFCSYVSIKENGYWTCAMGTGRSNGYDDIHDTLSISTSTDWENYDSLSIDDKEIAIEIGNHIYTYSINYINEDEMSLTTNTEGVGVWTEYYRKITEDDMVYVWIE